MVALAPDNVRRALAALGRLGFRPRAPVAAEEFADPAARAAWAAEKGMSVFSLWSAGIPGIEVDLFVREPFDFDQAFRRAVRVPLDTTSATVVSLEDLVAMKRAAGRPLDLADVAALEAIAGKAGPR